MDLPDAYIAKDFYDDHLRIFLKYPPEVAPFVAFYITPEAYAFVFEPEDPEGLHIHLVNTITFRIEWEVISQLDKYYFIERSIDLGVTYQQLAIVNGNVFEYTDIVPSVDVYFYRVRAFRIDIFTDYSNFIWNTVFSFPTAGIPVIVGREFILRGEALVYMPLENDVIVTYTCDVGIQQGNDLVINAVAGDIGNHVLDIEIENGGGQLINVSTNIRVYAALTVENIKLLMLGDSTTANGVTNIGNGLNAYYDPTVTYLGTQGGSIKHEARSGFTWLKYITLGSPFFKAGILDVPAYFTDNVIDTPDYVHIRLGVNEAFAECDDEMTVAELNTIITNAKTLIDGFLNFDANLKVIISFPTICEDTGAGWANNYDETVYLQARYMQIIQMIWSRYKLEFDAAAYNARVFISNEVAFLDRDDGYPKTDGIHTNGVHLSTDGYKQIGRAMASVFNMLET